MSNIKQALSRNHCRDENRNLGDLHKQVLEKLATKQDNEGAIALANVTQDLHVWPDFHGNRSPIADPALKGGILGLTFPVRLFVAKLRVGIQLSHQTCLL